MLEQVDLTKKLSKAEYKERMGALKMKMYDIGHGVYESKTPVIVVVEGWGQAGKGRTIAELTTRMDPRGLRVYVIDAPAPPEDEYPWMHRFWLKTPARGEISIFENSWYRRVLVDRVEKRISKKEWTQSYQDILDFERMLADDGVIFVKFWLHISREEQARRQNKLLKSKRSAWRVSAEERAEQKHYDKYCKAVEEMFARSEAEHASWAIVAATDQRWRNVRIFETIIARLEPHVAPHEAPLPETIDLQLRAISTADGMALTSDTVGTAAEKNRAPESTAKTVGDQKSEADA